MQPFHPKNHRPPGAVKAIAAVTSAMGVVVATGNVPALACGVVAVALALALLVLVRS